MDKDSTDEQIAGLVQKGDAEMFGLLIERYEPKISRYGKRFLADPDDIKDSVQDVFIKAYTNIASFDLAKKFSPWIYRIAHNCFINELKKRKRIFSVSIDTDLIFPQLFSSDDPEKDILDKELKENIDACVDKIDIKYKEILILFYLEELSYKEISDILHIPLSLVGIRLNRGKKAMRKIMKL